MPVTLFIQEHSGDHNFEAEFKNRYTAEKAVSQWIAKGGYWMNADKLIWVPWHRVDYVRFDETNG
jgi:hypothetical protein